MVGVGAAAQRLHRVRSRFRSLRELCAIAAPAAGDRRPQGLHRPQRGRRLARLRLRRPRRHRLHRRVQGAGNAAPLKVTVTPVLGPVVIQLVKSLIQFVISSTSNFTNYW